VETPSLYGHLTGFENLEITRRLLEVERDSIPRVLDLVGLGKAAARRVSGYSQGMKQRLALGLALLGEPELLILDEPTNGLDPAGILEMRELIREMPARSGTSVFLSSHLLNEVEQVATHIAVIQKGRLMFQGTLNDLQKLKKVRTRLKVDNSVLAVGLIMDMGITHVETGPGQVIFIPETEEDEAGRINTHLVTHGIRVFHLEVEAPTLEDLFLSLTEEEGHPS
jgi:ABC-2 type transport system ATP-binding protein